jgi:hypothetical protein
MREPNYTFAKRAARTRPDGQGRGLHGVVIGFHATRDALGEHVVRARGAPRKFIRTIPLQRFITGAPRRRTFDL